MAVKSVPVDPNRDTDDEPLRPPGTEPSTRPDPGFSNWIGEAVTAEPRSTPKGGNQTEYPPIPTPGRRGKIVGVAAIVGMVGVAIWAALKFSKAGPSEKPVEPEISDVERLNEPPPARPKLPPAVVVAAGVTSIEDTESSPAPAQVAQAEEVPIDLLPADPPPAPVVEVAPAPAPPVVVVAPVPPKEKVQPPPAVPKPPKVMVAKVTPKPKAPPAPKVTKVTKTVTKAAKSPKVRVVEKVVERVVYRDPPAAALPAAPSPTAPPPPPLKRDYIAEAEARATARTAAIEEARRRGYEQAVQAAAKKQAPPK